MYKVRVYLNSNVKSQNNLNWKTIAIIEMYNREIKKKQLLYEVDKIVKYTVFSAVLSDEFIDAYNYERTEERNKTFCDAKHAHRFCSKETAFRLTRAS